MGAVSKGCGVKSKWETWRVGGGQEEGGCWGMVLGLSLAQVLLQLLLSPDPPPTTLATLQHIERE